MAATFVDTVTANVRAFLAGRPRAITMSLEDPLGGFEQVWQLGGVEGDYASACAEWGVQHNARRS
ncbi:MAG: hypothetical protein FJW80_05845 [Actinobacteria bacterium]|nr:hypothetical protein [Actinomycetota bacterium]